MRLLLASVALCPFAASADIQPRDGHWGTSAQFLEERGCPAQMATQMNVAPGFHFGDIVFPDPFDPVALQAADFTFAWAKLGENLWEGVHTRLDETGMGAMRTVVTTRLQVMTETHIEQRAEVVLHMPPAMAGAMGMASPTCTVRQKIDHVWAR